MLPQRQVRVRVTLREQWPVRAASRGRKSARQGRRRHHAEKLWLRSSISIVVAFVIFFIVFIVQHPPEAVPFELALISTVRSAPTRPLHPECRAPAARKAIVTGPAATAVSGVSI